MVTMLLLVTALGHHHNDLHIVGNYKNMRECRTQQKENQNLITPPKGQRFIYICAKRI